MADVLPLPSPNKRKLIFVAVIAAVFLTILVLVLSLSDVGKPAAGKGFKPEKKEVVIWTVNMAPTIFETLTKGFNDYVGRNDMKLVVRNFGSYDDYLDILPRAIHAKASPDIFVVPNHGGHTLWDPYIVYLGEDYIDFKDFETRYHPLFVDELIFEEKQKVKGSNQLVRGIRGIPVGFEPMGIYYNRKIISSVPTFWDKIPELITEDAKTNTIPTLSLGYGRATPVSSDIVPLLTMQERGVQLNTYSTLDSVESRATIEKYLDYRREPNNLNQFKDAYDNTLTNADLFVRGKVGTLVGYPSTFNDIELAKKRAKKDKALAEAFDEDVRWTTIPQVEEDPKKQINLARYMYFALSKTGMNRNFEKPSNDPAIKFMQFLNTAKAQETFFRNHEYYLPSQLDLLRTESKTRIDGKDGPGMIVSDWYVSTQKFIAYNMGIPHFFTYIAQKALDEPGATSSVISGNMLEFLNCKIKHLSDPDTYEKSCECRTDVSKNNNNYWPLCGNDV